MESTNKLTDDLYKIKTKIEPKLRKGLITSKILLGRSRFIEEASTKSSSFNDPAYFPFYYHLAAQLKTKSLVQIGTQLALPAACFAQGSPLLETYLGLETPTPGEFYSPRLAKGNVRDHMKKFAFINIHVGLITDPEFLHSLKSNEWDVAIVTEQTDYERHRSYLNVLWDRMRLGGIIAVDFMDRHEPSRKAFEDVCRVKNRDPVIVSTRYGTGLVQK
jgi:predicted O-methyltransferase YrrM